QATPKPPVSQLAKTPSIREETLADASMRVLLVWNRHHNFPDRLGRVLHALPHCQPESESRSRLRGRPQFRKGSIRRCRGRYFGLSLRPTCSNHSRHRHAWRFYRTDGPDNATGQRRPAKQYSLIRWIASIGCPLSPRDWGRLRVSFLLPCNQAEGGLFGNVAPRIGSAIPDLSRRNPRSSRWERWHSSSRCFQVGRSPRGERYRSLWGVFRFRCSGLRLP